MKAATLAICVLPGLLIGFRYAAGELGALPTKTALHLLGLWSLRFLLITLALTPLQRLLLWPQLAQIRRIIGTTAAVYAGLHLAFFLPFMGFSASKMASEIVLRPYLAIGAVAFILLTVLAFTSTDRQISKLGKNWKPLHRTIYAIVPLALLHMALQEKIDATQPLQLAALFILMMYYRGVMALRWSPTATTLAATSVIAAATSLAIEALWYGWFTGVAASRVVAANWSFDAGLRPAQLVLLVGLFAAGLVHFLPARRLKPASISR